MTVPYPACQDCPTLIQRLLRADAWPHPVADIRLIETHISWLLLTGEHAYKVKKPVNLGFLDFSSLALRRQACEQELRLNRRLAADVYQAVVPITGSVEQPRVGGTAEIIEYAVRMRQFDPQQGFGQMLEQGELPAGILDELAEIIARFHEIIPPADSGQRWGEPATVIGPMHENFAPIERAIAAQPGYARLADMLEPLRHWIDQRATDLNTTLRQRKADGFVRECHGDLHLDNVVLSNHHPLVFDCIEFNPALRWIDVISEVAFTRMDLDHRGRPDLGNRFINHYLEHSGDYQGLSVLPLYQVYRALVRAKVEAIGAGQHRDGREAAMQRVAAYLQLADSYTRPHQPRLLITHGLSGSGKTFWSGRLLAELDNGIRIRSDVERKRLYKLRPLETSGSQNAGDGIYTAAANTATYQRLADLARTLVTNGFTVIVEATFLWHTGRQQFRQLADDLGVPFLILDFQASTAILEQRVARRSAAGSDASEADVAILHQQLQKQQPLTPQELPAALGIDTEASPDMAALARQICS